MDAGGVNPPGGTQGQARDFPALVALAVARGYEQPERWAERVLAGRALRAARRARSVRNLRGKPI